MTKPIYKASDGSEHATAKAVQYQDRIVKAAKRLDDAVKELETLLAGAALTADGQHFNTSASSSYWIVHEHYGRMPWMRQVYIYPHHISVDLDRTHNDLVLREYSHDQKGYITYKVRELYADEKNARAALIKACAAWLAQQEAEILKYRKEHEARK